MVLNVGARRHKCFIHNNTLTDYASGHEIHDLAPARIAHHMSSGIVLPVHDAAQQVINDLVNLYGEDVIIDKFAALPVLNVNGTSS